MALLLDEFDRLLYRIEPVSTRVSINEIDPALLNTGKFYGNMSITEGFLQSDNFVTGSTGWQTTAEGEFEANSGTFRGSLVAGSIDIPDTTSANSFHVDSDGNTWWGATTLGSAVASVTRAGVGTFSKINISGGSDVTFVSDTLDTSSKKILSDFNFGTTDYAGAVKSGDITWNTTTGAITGGSGVVVYRSGIVGANAGVTTFSIDATTGDATFAGTITGSTITGGVFQTAISGSRIILSSTGNDLALRNSSDAEVLIISDQSSSLLSLKPPTGANTALLIQNQGAGSHTARLVEIDMLNASSTATTMYISNVGSGDALEILSTGSSRAIDVTATGANVITVTQSHSSHRAISIDNNTSSDGVIDIDLDANNGNNCIGIKMNITNIGGGTEYAFHFDGSEYDATKTSVSGLTGVIKILTVTDGAVFIPVYDTAT